MEFCLALTEPDAGTTPKEKAPKRTLGLSLFIIDLPNPTIEVIPIEKHGINYSKTCLVYINDLKSSQRKPAR